MVFGTSTWDTIISVFFLPRSLADSNRPATAGEFDVRPLDNFHIDLKFVKKSDQPARRESSMPAADEFGDVRLFESEPRGSLHLT